MKSKKTELVVQGDQLYWSFPSVRIPWIERAWKPQSQTLIDELFPNLIKKRKHCFYFQVNNNVRFFKEKTFSFITVETCFNMNTFL